MNDEINAILSQLESHVEDTPLEQIIDELLVVHERLSFAGFGHGADGGDPQQQRHQIEFVLGRDVSAGMVQFVTYLADQHALHYVTDDLTSVFIDYCKTYFLNRTQITVTTAIAVSQSTREHIKAELKQLYPANTRFLFMTNRSLIAGVTIKINDRQTDDLSFKTQVVKLIQERVKNQQQEYYAPAN